jgi:hypothetical protein
VIYHDPVYQRCLNDRDWAPPGGTSINRAGQLNAEFSRNLREALRVAVDAEPGMHARFDCNLPWLWVDGDETGGWWIGAGLVHEIHEAEGDLRTFLWASYVSDDEDTVVEGGRPIDVTLAGPGARDADRLARMVVEALRPYRDRNQRPR